MNLSQKKLLDIAQNAINELEFSEYEHETILEYLQINEEENLFTLTTNDSHYAKLKPKARETYLNEFRTKLDKVK